MRVIRGKTYMDNTRRACVPKVLSRHFGVEDFIYPKLILGKSSPTSGRTDGYQCASLQGSAADIIKRAMISLDRWLLTHDSDAKMIMQVHDELVFEVKVEAVDRLIEAVREHMMNAAKLDVPLLVSIGIGDNWDAASGE